MAALAGIVLVLALLALQALAIDTTGLPSYHFGAPIRVECMNRSS